MKSARASYALRWPLLFPWHNHAAFLRGAPLNSLASQPPPHLFFFRIIRDAVYNRRKFTLLLTYNGDLNFS